MSQKLNVFYVRLVEVDDTIKFYCFIIIMDKG